MAMNPSSPTALGHLRVLDLGGPAAQFCARLLGDFGADVIKAEPPGGDPARFQGPFAGGRPDAERGLPFINHNHNKRSIVLDLSVPEGRETLKALARTADVVVESFPMGHLTSLGLDGETLREANPGLIDVSITSYGHEGPFAGFQGTELTIQAMSGMMYIHGDGDAPPCLVPAEQLHQVAGYHALLGAMAAVRARAATGLGQHVDVSMQDVGLWLLMMVIGNFSLNQADARRVGASPSNPGVSIYRARDGGYVQTSPYMDRHLQALAGLLNAPDLPEKAWQDPAWRRANMGLIDERTRDLVAGWDRDAFVAEAQARGLPCTPILKVSEFAEHPHMRERDWFADLDHPVIGRYRAAGAPYRLSATPWSVRRPAPRLGEHTREVLHELEGRDVRGMPPSGSLNVGAATPLPTVPRGAAAPTPGGSKGGHPLGGPSPTKPLEGVRVVDFTQAVAGPVTTMFLGFLGAEVIKVETAARPQQRRPDQPGFAELNRNKRSATINAQDPQGYQMALRLIERSDVVVDNFRAGVMDRMGLGYEKLRQVKPDVIVVQMPGMGLSGPLSEYITYGQQVFGICGLGYLWGHPDAAMETRPKVGYTDYVAGAATAGAIAIALEHRRRTGQGQFIEAAQVEALAATLGTQYLEWTVNGAEPEPGGNLSDRYAPHNVYPCLGHDAWCAIVCRDDDDWQRLAAAMGNPDWARDERWSTTAGRVVRREELDERIAQWTRTLTPRQLFHKLQRAGVPAGMDQGPEALTYDPHLRVRGSIVRVQAAKPWDTWLDHPALPARLSETPGSSDVPAPTEGQDNGYVFRQVMGLSDEEVERLTREGALK